MSILHNEYSIPPLGAGAYSPQILAGMGTTESHNAQALRPGRTASLITDDVAVFASFRSAVGLANQVDAATAVRIPPNTIFKFRILENVRLGFGSTVVYVEAADGSSSYRVCLWQDSE